MAQSRISKYFQNSDSNNSPKNTGNTEINLRSPASDDEARFNSAVFIESSDKPKRASLSSSGITSSKRAKRKAAQNVRLLTPMEKQIVRLKLSNQDKILAVNVGYKYKFFGSDSRIVSSILNIIMVPGKEKFTSFLLDDNQGSSCIEEDPNYPNDKFYDKLAYCSIPDLRLSIHLKKLLKYGHKVGIIEQLQDVESETRLVIRRLTKTYTKATYLEDYSLSHPELTDSFFQDDDVIHNNNSVMALIETDNTYSLISVNLITGQIVYDTFKDNSFSKSELDSRMYHIAPTEVIIFNDLSNALVSKLKLIPNLRIEMLPRENLDTFYIEKLADIIDNDLEKNDSREESDDDSFLSDFDDSALMKCSLILEFINNEFTADLKLCLYNILKYLKDFNMIFMFSRLSNYKPFIEISRMNLSKDTLISLDILQDSSTGKLKGSLYDLLNHTRTHMGARLLKEWIIQPLVNRDQIDERLQSIEDIQESRNIMLVEKLSKLLTGLPDLNCMISKVTYGTISRKDFYLFLKTLMNIVQDIQLVKNEYLKTTQMLNSVKSPLFSGIVESAIRHAQQINTVEENYYNFINAQVALDSKKLNENSHLYFKSIYPDYKLILVHCNKIEDIKHELDNVLQTYKSFLNKPLLKFTNIGSEEFLIEILKSNINKIPNNFIKFNETKHVIRFRTPQIFKLLTELKEEKSHLRIISNKCFKKFIDKFSSEFNIEISGLISQLSQLDCLFSITAALLTYTKPKFVDSQVLNIHEARHPMIEAKLANSSFIANNIDLCQDGTSALILTGANMGGKSTYVRSIALIVIMAQIGCYVPASNAVLGVFDSVFTRMGFNDDLIRGKSTFMVEMEQCLQILKSSSSRSLVILDELGRGTSTTDGIAVAYSILRYFLDFNGKNNPLILFITHFIELCSLEDEYPNKVKNVHMAYREIRNHEHDNIGDIVFLFKLVDGFSESSFGLNTAKVCLLDKSIIDSAFAISKTQRASIKSRQNMHGILEIVKKLAHSENAKPETIKEFKQRILELE